jgi:hypothetical protein
MAWYFQLVSFHFPHLHISKMGCHKQMPRVETVEAHDRFGPWEWFGHRPSVSETTPGKTRVAKPGKI